MSKRKRSRPSATAPGRGGQGAGKPAKTHLKIRRRGLSWVLGGVILLVGIAVVATAASSGSGSTAPNGGAGAGTPASAHAVAPNGSFTTAAGATETVSSLHGRPTLLWFVTTWCSSCQAGTQAMSAQIPTLAARHVRVVELELSGDLGQPGPAISDFARQLAGSRLHDPDWIFGTASPVLTQAYDPNGYLDVYYLLDAAGHVTYANSSPAATMSQLLSAAAKIAPHA
jgi:cytochrome oxidase Cu insertion factor (SCO1/SenC/PrrC family)